MTLIIQVKVMPNSSKNAWVMDASGTLKCYLKSKPEKGRANKELVRMLAHDLGIAQQNVILLSGQTARTKRIKISASFSKEELLKKLGLESGEQGALF